MAGQDPELCAFQLWSATLCIRDAEVWGLCSLWSWRDSSGNFMCLSHSNSNPIENQFVDLLGIEMDWIWPDSTFLEVAIMDGHGCIGSPLPELQRGANEPLIPRIFCGRTCTSPIDRGSGWDPKSNGPGVERTEGSLNFAVRSFQIIESFRHFGLTWTHSPAQKCLLPWQSVVRLVFFSSRLLRFACGSLLLLIFMLVLVTPVSVSSELNTIIPDPAVGPTIPCGQLLNGDYHILSLSI